MVSYIRCSLLLSADTEEHKSLVQGLALIKDNISQVNAQVSEFEKDARLRDIGQRLEPKSQGRMKNGGVLRREDLLQENRTLLHEGTVTWKTSGRQKGLTLLALSFSISPSHSYASDPFGYLF